MPNPEEERLVHEMECKDKTHNTVFKNKEPHRRGIKNCSLQHFGVESDWCVEALGRKTAACSVD